MNRIALQLLPCAVVALALFSAGATAQAARGADPRGNLGLEIVGGLGAELAAMASGVVIVCVVTAKVHPDGCTTNALLAGGFIGSLGGTLAVPFGVWLMGNLSGGTGDLLSTSVGAAIPVVAAAYVGITTDPTDPWTAVAIGGLVLVETAAAVTGYRLSAQDPVEVGVDASPEGARIVVRGRF